MRLTNEEHGSPAFTIVTPTLCEGTVPTWRDEAGFPVTYATERAAQIEIAEMMIENLQQFLAGERDFDDALHCEDFIVPVTVLPDQKITLETGETFGRRQP